MYDSLMDLGHKYGNLVGKKWHKSPQMFCIILYKNDL